MYVILGLSHTPVISDISKKAQASQMFLDKSVRVFSHLYMLHDFSFVVFLFFFLNRVYEGYCLQAPRIPSSASFT